MTAYARERHVVQLYNDGKIKDNRRSHEHGADLFCTRLPDDSPSYCKGLRQLDETEHQHILTSSSSPSISLLGNSFFGFRPGFGFAGIIHSLDAVLSRTYMSDLLE